MKIKIFALLLSFFFMSNVAFAKWGEWESLGGTIKGAPAFSVSKTSANGESIYLVAAHGMDDSLWVRMKIGKDSNWGEWQNLGGKIIGSPACVSKTYNEINCYVVNLNHDIIARQYSAGKWSEYTTIVQTDVKVSGQISVFNWDGQNIQINAYGSKKDSPDGWFRLNWSEISTNKIPRRQPSRYDPRTGTGGGIENGWLKWISIYPQIDTKLSKGSNIVCDGFVHGISKIGSAGHLGNKIGLMGFCATPFLSSTDSYLITEYGGNILKTDTPEKSAKLLKDLVSNYAPTILAQRDEEFGLSAVIRFTNKKDNSLYYGRWVYGKGWQKFSDGSTFRNFGGSLTSSPSCSVGYCIARGQDGAVWLTGSN